MSDLVAGSAIVTGAGSGIGRAIALILATRGASVGLLDVLPEGYVELGAAIEQQGGRAAVAQAGVSRWEDVDRAVAARAGILFIESEATEPGLVELLA